MPTLRTVTAVAYHPRGLDLHLSNLRWALPAAAHSVFTRPEYGFRRPGVDFLTVPETRAHLDYHSRLLPDLLDADVLFLGQQDFPLYKPAPESVQRCYDQQTIVVGAHANSEYFSLYDERGGKVYPRLWEGDVFYPVGFFREAVRDGIHLGFGLRAFGSDGAWLRDHRRLLERTYFRLRGERYRVYEFLTGAVGQDLPRADLFTEATLYAYCRGYSWVAAPYGAVHLQGPEKAHRLRPESYERPEVITEIEDFRLAPKMVNWTAIAYLLSGVLEPGERAEALVAHDYGDPRFGAVREALGCLSGTAKQWMNAEACLMLEWARRLLNHKAGVP